MLRQLHAEPFLRREFEPALAHHRLNVVDEILHDLPALSGLEADFDRVSVARAVGPTERKQGNSKPLIEKLLRQGALPLVLTELLDYPLAETFVFCLLFQDFTHNSGIGRVAARTVERKLKLPRAVEKKLSHGQLQPAFGQGN